MFYFGLCITKIDTASEFPMATYKRISQNRLYCSEPHGTPDTFNPISSTIQLHSLENLMTHEQWYLPLIQLLFSQGFMKLSLLQNCAQHPQIYSYKNYQFHEAESVYRVRELLSLSCR